MNNWLIQYKTDQIMAMEQQINTLQAEIHRLKVYQVAIVVCTWHNISIDDLVSKCRKWHLVYARMMYTFICIKMIDVPVAPTMSYINRNRTTSNSQIQAHNDMVATDTEYKTTFENILKKLQLWEEHSE